MYNTVHRHDKWVEHCKKKHSYKFKNNITIKYKVIAVKEGDGPWTPYIESNEVASSTSTKSTEELDR